MKDPFFVDKCYLMVESSPHTYEYSSYDPRWKTIMKEEYNSLQKNDTWELVDLPLERNLVKCKWVYKTKFVADVLPFKYKEKFAAKG